MGKRDLPGCQAAVAGNSPHRLTARHEKYLVSSAIMLAGNPKYNDTNVTKALIRASKNGAIVTVVQSYMRVHEPGGRLVNWGQS